MVLWLTGGVGLPYVADELNEEEGPVRKGLRLVQRPVGGVVEAVVDRHVLDDRYPEVGVGLQAEGQNGRQDEED